MCTTNHVLSINITEMFQQQLNDLDVTLECRKMQWCFVDFRSRIFADTGSEQHFAGIVVISLCGYM